MTYFFALIITFFLSVILTLVVKKIAFKYKILDYPDFQRKIHKVPIPLLGGVAIFLSFTIVLIYYSFFTNLLIYGFILPKHVIGIILAALIIVIGGVLDDKFNLKPKYQIIFPILATLIIMASGISINYIRNPFGNIISFKNWDFNLFYFQGIPYKITLLADFFTLFWLLGIMYTTKLLDGLDGLVSGITIISSLIIFCIAMSKSVAQYNTALIALILAGAFLGFLFFNFHPAKIFLGEGGSLFAGLMLGVLAIISGSKVATTLLILGIPILDVVWVIIRRMFTKKSISLADRKHFHFRLLDIGLNQRQAVIFMYSLTASFGIAALFLQTMGKFIALLVLAALMLILAGALVIIYKYKNKF